MLRLTGMLQACVLRATAEPEEVISVDCTIPLQQAALSPQAYYMTNKSANDHYIKSFWPCYH